MSNYRLQLGPAVAFGGPVAAEGQQSFLVRAGSTARRNGPAKIKRHLDLQSTLLAEGVLAEHPENQDLYIFRLDHEFSSATAAGDVINDGNLSAPSRWLNVDTGQSLRDDLRRIGGTQGANQREADESGPAETADGSDVASAVERAASILARRALNTASQANGQQVQKTLKVKHCYFTSEELAAYIEVLILKQGQLCALTGLPLQFEPDFDDPEMVCSLDRIDSDGHYERGNLQVVCRFVNRWKSDAIDAEFRRLLGKVRQQS